MKKFWKRTLAGIMILCMFSAMGFSGGSTLAYAKVKTYVDVAGHQYEEALLYAIQNGLMSNSGTKIFPDSALTKGAASLSLNNLLGATKGYDTMDEVGNLKPGAKYYTTVSRGLNCGYLKQKSNGDVYSPLAKATYGYVADIFSSVLGIDMKKEIIGSNNPKDTLTRAEYAVILKKLAPNIITKSTFKVVDGDVYLTKSGTELSNATVNGNLIVTDAIGDGEVKLRNVIINGTLVVRGGGENSILVTGRSTVANIIVQQVNNNVRVKIYPNASVKEININKGSQGIAIEGKAETVNIKAELIPVTLRGAEVNSLVLTGKGLGVNIPSDTKIKSLEIAESAQGGRLDIAGTIEDVNVAAKDSNISLKEKGKITKVRAEKTAESFNLEVTKDAVVENVTSEADNTSISGEGNVKESELSGSKSEDKSTGAASTPTVPPTTTPLPTSSPSGGNSEDLGSGGTGGTPTPTPTPRIFFIDRLASEHLPQQVFEGAVPPKTVNNDFYTGTVKWEGNPEIFIKGESYTATITLIANSWIGGAVQFSSTIDATLYGPSSVEVISNTGTTFIFKMTLTAVDAYGPNLQQKYYEYTSIEGDSKNSDAIIEFSRGVGSLEEDFVGIYYNGKPLTYETDYYFDNVYKSGIRIGLTRSCLSNFAPSEVPYMFELKFSKGTSVLFTVTVKNTSSTSEFTYLNSIYNEFFTEQLIEGVPHETLPSSEFGFATDIKWEGNPERFIVGQLYTAIVTLTAVSTPYTTYQFAPNIKTGINDAIELMRTNTILQFKLTKTAVAFISDYVFDSDSNSDISIWFPSSINMWKTLDKVTMGDNLLVKEIDYSIGANIVTIENGFLKNLQPRDTPYKFTIEFKDGTKTDFTVIIKNPTISDPVNYTVNFTDSFSGKAVDSWTVVNTTSDSTVSASSITGSVVTGRLNDGSYSIVLTQDTTLNTAIIGVMVKGTDVVLISGNDSLLFVNASITIPDGAGNISINGNAGMQGNRFNVNNNTVNVTIDGMDWLNTSP